VAQWLAVRTALIEHLRECLLHEIVQHRTRLLLMIYPMLRVYVDLATVSYYCIVHVLKTIQKHVLAMMSAASEFSDDHILFMRGGWMKVPVHLCLVLLLD
jgi:hypothetical protein